MDQDSELMVAELLKSLKQHMASMYHSFLGAMHDIHTLEIILKIEPSNSCFPKNAKEELERIHEKEAKRFGQCSCEG